MDALVDGLVVGLLGALCLLLGLSVRRRNVAAAVNTLFVLVLVLVALDVAAGSRPPWSGAVDSPELALWAAVAAVLHSVGMLGFYDSVWWWDHLTHTVSSAFITALVYASVITTTTNGDLPALSPLAIAAVTVGYTVGLGVFWELVELGARDVGERFDVEPLLVHYGWRDTAFDMGFNLVGALAVVALDIRVFVEVTDGYPELSVLLLNLTGGVVAGGSILLALLLGVSENHDAW